MREGFQQVSRPQNIDCPFHVVSQKNQCNLAAHRPFPLAKTISAVHILFYRPKRMFRYGFPFFDY
jgi:hypothetical protein